MHFSECNIFLKYNCNFFKILDFFQRTLDYTLVSLTVNIEYLHNIYTII